MRFLLDENVHAKSTAALRALGHDVLHVIDSQLRGKSDTELIQFCNENNRIFVTRDLDVAKEAASVRTGLILIRVPGRFVSRNIPGLLATFTVTATDADLLGHVTAPLPGQVRRRALSTLTP